MQNDSIENQLKERGAEFHYVPALDLSKIDRDTSFRNQARVMGKATDDDVVIIYAEAMEKGDEFPPIVVYLKDGKYINVDGNHRYAAANVIDKSTLPAYVIDNPNDSLIAVLTYTMNTQHGFATALAERLLQAVWLIELGVKPQAAATTLRVPLGRVRVAWANSQADKRLAGLGVGRWDSLFQTTRRRLGDIRSDRVLKEAGTLTVRAKLAFSDVDTMVTQINTFRNEKEQVTAIKAFATDFQSQVEQTAGGLFDIPKPIAAISTTLGRLQNVDVGAIKEANLTPEYKQKLLEKLVGGNTRLQEISEALKG